MANRRSRWRCRASQVIHSHERQLGLLVVRILRRAERSGLQDKTYYRVRVGPYNKIDELNKTRAELAKNGIEAQLAKNKE